MLKNRDSIGYFFFIGNKRLYYYKDRKKTIKEAFIASKEFLLRR